MKRLIASALTIFMILGTTNLACASTSDWEATKYQATEAAMRDTANYIVEKVPSPEIGSIGGEWSIIGLTACGYPIPPEYNDAYYKRVETSLKENMGILTTNKYTEYARLIIALTAIGKDVTNVAGYNLLEKLADFEKIKKQGINGPIYALIALDSHNYEIPEMAGIANKTTRKGLIDYILAQEITNENGVIGGFNLGGSLIPDADITGMALQALANYKEEASVKGAIDRGIQALNTIENEKGTFSSGGVETVESIVQVIVAKSALGMDASKNMEGLLLYYEKGKGFAHVMGQGANLLATEQSLYAMAAYKLGVTENRSLYDSNAILIKGEKNKINIRLNGQPLVFAQEPVVVEGRTLLPMRGVFEALGAQIFWDDGLKQVKGILGDKTVQLKIGSKSGFVNGVEASLEVPAQLVNGRTLVPVRFIGESLNLFVDWDPVTRTVILEKKD